MASRRKRRRGSSPWPALLALLVVAVLVSCGLFRPRHQRSEPSVAVSATPALATATPVAPITASASPTPSPLQTATQSPAPAATRTSPTQHVVGHARLALIVDDCGQWLDIERGYIALPIPLTMSILPYVHGATVIAGEAQAAGKGIMLHLPMETLSGMYPGPGEITTAMTDAQVEAQTRDDLAQVPLAQGVNNHEGSKASADARVMHDVMSVLAQHGHLFFIDSRTNPASVGASQATAAGIPNASRDVFLDNKEDVAYSEGQLREAAAIALRNGSAIAIGHPRATTLEAVRDLYPELQAEGITFVLAGDLTQP